MVITLQTISVNCWHSDAVIMSGLKLYLYKYMCKYMCMMHKLQRYHFLQDSLCSAFSFYHLLTVITLQTIFVAYLCSESLTMTGLHLYLHKYMCKYMCMHKLQLYHFLQDSLCSAFSFFYHLLK